MGDVQASVLVAKIWPVGRIMGRMFVCARRRHHVRESRHGRGDLDIGITGRARSEFLAVGECGQPAGAPGEGSPALRHSAAIERAAAGVNAPRVAVDPQIERACAPQLSICSAPVAAGIVR